jgi:hypothetical protein
MSDKFDKEVYDAGYQVAKENIDSIKAVIKRKVKE